MIPSTEFARIGYTAYCTAVGGKAFNGDDLPAFDDIPQRIKDAWAVAGTAIADRVREETPR
jgi:hypothetical protein